MTYATSSTAVAFNVNKSLFVLTPVGNQQLNIQNQHNSDVRPPSPPQAFVSSLDPPTHPL